MSGWTVPGYTRLKPLDTGGFTAVVLARHDATGIPVAIKYLRPDLAADPGFTAMFRSEAVLLSSLESPYVVRLYEYVESAAGTAVVMELVDGVSLRDLLAARDRTTPEAALAVLYSSLIGLAAAHACGVVHRDYKPGNILINAHGASKLTDFGIATRAGRRSFPAGSLAYAPPEQFDGVPASPASDVYAATATFYACLTGHPPFRGNSTGVLRYEQRARSVPMDQVPGPLQPLVAAGLAKDPRHRPADAGSFAAGLRTAAELAYGPEWEERGRAGLSAAALDLAAQWPTGGAAAVPGLAPEQVQLARGYQPAGGQAAPGQAAQGQAAQGQAGGRSQPTSPGRRRGRRKRLAHLRRLRRLRAAAAGAAAAAIIAAGATYAFTGSPSGVGSAAGDPARAAFSVPLQTVPVASSAKVVTGDSFVYYNPGGEAGTTLTGTIEDAAAGQVVRLYARQFPYTGTWTEAGSAPVSPSGGAAQYSFKVTPTLATQYQVKLFNDAADTSPVIGLSAAKTIYVVLGSPYLHVTCTTGVTECSVEIKQTFYAPSSLVAAEMAKHWYVYAGVDIEPGTAGPPDPKTLTLGGLSSSIGEPTQTGDGTFTMTIKLRYEHALAEPSTFVWWPCAPGTEAEDGFGLPGSHGCGTQTSVRRDIAYLG